MTEPTPAPAYEEEKRDLLHDRRALGIIGGAVVVVAALGYFVVVPLLGGSSSSSDNGAVPSAHHHVVAARTPSASPSASAPVVAGVASAAPALNVRDPFKPLVVAATGGGAATKTSPSATPTPSVTAQVPTVVVVQPQSPAQQSVQQQTFAVKLVSVSPATHTATFTVNGKTYKPVVGTSNAAAANFPSAANGPFQLESVSATGVQLMYGSEASSLTTGQSRTFD